MAVPAFCRGAAVAHGVVSPGVVRVCSIVVVLYTLGQVLAVERMQEHAMREGWRPVHVEEYVAHERVKPGRPGCHAYVRVKLAKWVRGRCVAVGAIGSAAFVAETPLFIFNLQPFLCADSNSDHLDCHGGDAFGVALVGTDVAGTTHAALYSSATDAWSGPASIDHHPDAFVQARRPSVLVGNALYFLCDNNTSIVEFDMATMTLSVIPSPPLPEDVHGALLMTAEGGGLGFAAVLERSNLHLWSKSMDQWEHLEDVRDLKTLLPRGSISMMNNVLIGFADGGVRVVVVRSYHGPFIVELGSTGPARVALRRSGIYAVFPYTSFCTPGDTSSY
uniref:Uncharacterized protein n=1 Tax=Oryza rufipogon TaxID=4529 RepID=A0A0E0PVT2_ORYRU